jgi:ubiquinone/menaquinone biosynthesis C-methylase UbiE
MASVGLAGTALILWDLAGPLPPARPVFWLALAAAALLTLANVQLRTLRWIFLLRRANARIPIRDAYIGYLAGLSLLLTPLLAGEIAVRTVVHRARGGLPVPTTIAINLWERLLDVVAVALIAGAFGLALGELSLVTAGALVAGAATLASPVRRGFLRVAAGLADRVGRGGDRMLAARLTALTSPAEWLVGLATSLGAWMLPGVAFWVVARATGHPLELASAAQGYAWSAAIGGVSLAPGGVLVAGGSLLETLQAAGFPAGAAALAVLGIRLTTVGVATMLGVVFLLVHQRSARSVGASHFDLIAAAYDAQIPEWRRASLIETKTRLMADVALARGGGRRGLDVGCGQGSYVARMRELGFEVAGIDDSAEQVRLAADRLGAAGLVTLGSVLRIPAPDAAYDFAYVINVLHHLPSIDEQRHAFAELMRVLRPGGTLFVHEINTRNVLFRFYMGYIFPSLNCIDEGVERWLPPHRLAAYTGAPIVEVRYFTFLPEFIPRTIARLLGPLERLLEASPLRVYSAHYMAVLRKPPLDSTLAPGAETVGRAARAV